MEDDPVCGSNGKTYMNQCIMAEADCIRRSGERGLEGGKKEGEGGKKVVGEKIDGAENIDETDEGENKGYEGRGGSGVGGGGSGGGGGGVYKLEVLHKGKCVEGDVQI